MGIKGWTAISFSFLLLMGCSLPAPPAAVLNESEKINYSIGYQLGSDFKKQGWTFDREKFLSGVEDSIQNTPPKLSPEEMSQTLTALKKKVVAAQKISAKEADTLYLTKHAQEEGVTVLPSGVQYKVLQAGIGAMPTLKDSVLIRYKVTRAGAPEIATDPSDNKPKTYELAKALPGLQEALQLMKEGSRWEIVLPPGPALGSKGETLEAAGVLIYDVELISVH